MEVYERIKARRKEIGLSADDVADALGVSRATVYRYECADIEKLPTTIIEPLAKVLRCSPVYLMGWDDNPLSLSDEETEIILAYRQADEVTRKMVQRSLDIEELLEYKNRNTPPNENLEILRKKA